MQGLWFGGIPMQHWDDEQNSGIQGSIGPKSAVDVKRVMQEL
jgi:hypothetical protein